MAISWVESEETHWLYPLMDQMRARTEVRVSGLARGAAGANSLAEGKGLAALAAEI